MFTHNALTAVAGCNVAFLIFLSISCVPKGKEGIVCWKRRHYPQKNKKKHIKWPFVTFSCVEKGCVWLPVWRVACLHTCHDILMLSILLKTCIQDVHFSCFLVPFFFPLLNSMDLATSHSFLPLLLFVFLLFTS